MSKIRSVRRTHYTTITNDFLRDESLSLEARGLLSICLSYSDEWNFTLKQLGKVTNKGRDTIGKYMKELINNGYVYRERLRDEKGRLSNYDYVFSDLKEDITFYISNNIEPMSEIPTQEKPTQEFSTTLEENKKEKNKKEPPFIEKRIENFKIEADKVFNENKEKFKNVDLKDYLNYWCEYSDSEMMFKAEKTGSFNHFNRLVSWNKKELKFRKENGQKKVSDKITDTKELKDYFKNKNLDNNNNQQIEIF